MMSEVWLWIFSFLIVAVAVGILLYQLLSLSDLEFDYINPFDSSARINKFVIPEFVIHGTLASVYLISGHWFMFLLNVPLLYIHTRLYTKKQHLVDVTEIFTHLGYEKKYRLIKLAFYVFLLCIIMYRLVMASAALIIDSVIQSTS